MATRLATGTQQKFWGMVETAFNTVQKPVADDALPLLNLDINPTQEYLKNMERTGTASTKNEVAGKEGGTWSATFYVKPNGSSATTAPDCGAILKAAFGYEDTTTDVTYSCHSSGADKTEPLSLQFHKTSGTQFYETASGCWVESVEFSIGANELATITASGGFCSYGFAKGATINGAGDAANAFVVVDANQAQRFRAGAYVQFRETPSSVNNNSGNFYLVTGIDSATHKVNLSPNAQTFDDDSTIESAAHAQTLTTNSPVSPVESDLSLGGTSMGFISASVNYTTGIKAREEAGQATPVGLSLGAREVTGSFNCFHDTNNAATSDISRVVADAWNGTTLAAIVRAGANTSTEMMKIQLPAIRPEVTAVEIPEAEEATVTINFVARVASTDGDEISVDFP